MTFRIVLFVMVAGIGLSVANVSGQQKNGKAPPKKKLVRPAVYFGNSDYCGGPIKKDKFCSLLRQGLSARDSLGNKYRIVSFDFSYNEQKIYEDSVGNLIRVMELFTERCKGDTLTTYLSKDADTSDGNYDVNYSIYQRIKPGDTVFIEHVAVVTSGKNSALSLPDSVQIAARGIKGWLVK